MRHTCLGVEFWSAQRRFRGSSLSLMTDLRCGKRHLEQPRLGYSRTTNRQNRQIEQNNQLRPGAETSSSDHRPDLNPEACEVHNPSCSLTTMSSSEHFPPPAPFPLGYGKQVVPLSLAPLHPSSGPDHTAVKGGTTSRSHSEVVDLSVFNILNIFCHRWFLSRANLLM